VKTSAIELNESEKEWFAVDGKELRGSIESGEKRGEALVLAVAHETGETLTAGLLFSREGIGSANRAYLVTEQWIIQTKSES